MVTTSPRVSEIGRVPDHVSSLGLSNGPNKEIESSKRVVPNAPGRTAKKLKGEGLSFGMGGPIKRAKLQLGLNRGRPRSNKGDLHCQKKIKPNKVNEMGESSLNDVNVEASAELQVVENILKTLDEKTVEKYRGCGGWPYAATRPQ